MEKSLYDKIQEAARFIQKQILGRPAFGIVLGTGLHQFTENLDDVVHFPYDTIPHFPVGKVESHRGSMMIGKINQTEVIVLSGRSHYYEGFSTQKVSFPVRVLAALGVQHIFFTNAAGGVNPHFKEGDIVAIEDHINFIPDNPLRGSNDTRLGLRFPDMMYAYCPTTIQRCIDIGSSLQISIKKGVYMAMAGPSLETPAEYNMAYRMGADLVGMSTVPEVIVARHAGLKVTAFSIVSNVCYPKQNLSPTTVEDVIKTVESSAEKINAILYKYFFDSSNNLTA
ncbi:MAG: purine-nucleoside phosphorylase [Saprospiraceae bacterium]